MAGHSKFANIKHKKERQDAKRGKVFTKLGRELAVAVKLGGPDPANNARLKDIMAKARASNMSNDTIERSIKKAAGELDNVNYEAITYEGYGPGGVAVIVETLTDNRTRTVANVRYAFTKGGGNMGQSGSVVFQFDNMGQIAVEKAPGVDEEELMMLALDAGAKDFAAHDEGYEIVTDPTEFSAVREAIETAGIPILSADVAMVPQMTVALTTPEDIKNMNKILNFLEEDDDVQNVYHNWEEEA
ncbi:MAG: YebC/PmpR family DNA-binding transcriptional regulator [Defluviitaleaceae bacterium]|nr:YebC/PmpR family DNA-binding transcriptional regulator [Defluviitaleaceae bacterium]